jgi:hypothetical protein
MLLTIIELHHLSLPPARDVGVIWPCRVVVIRASGWWRSGGVTPRWLVVMWQQCHVVVVVVVGDGR